MTEPFGYFKAEPFGWTDCSEDDEGAIALYEHPPAINYAEPVVWRVYCPSWRIATYGIWHNYRKGDRDLEYYLSRSDCRIEYAYPRTTKEINDET